MSLSSGQQFCYTQTPSKVLHLRNLPWECTEEELIELCKPFGKVVNTKCSVGANRNQAFVEFADLKQAISMITYYASSPEPAQIRRRTVYLQYSNRQEVINNKSTGDTSSNVLLVTIEGVEAGDVSIDVLHLVFSAFGFVHKIATFEKSAGFQALVQFSDMDTASSAKAALDGRSIPRYLLSEHVGPCNLRISYSAHTDLTVKFQSHRSRDYTNPNLPVAPSAIDGQAIAWKKEFHSNVILASIEEMQHPVTVEVLHTVFGAFGIIQKITIVGENAALVEYSDVATAATAKECLEGHCIYEGGSCKLHLSYSNQSDLNLKGPTHSVMSLNMAPGVTSGSSSLFERSVSPSSLVPYDSSQGLYSPSVCNVSNGLVEQPASTFYRDPATSPTALPASGILPYQALYGQPSGAIGQYIPNPNPAISLYNQQYQSFSMHGEPGQASTAANVK